MQSSFRNILGIIILCYARVYSFSIINFLLLFHCYLFVHVIDISFFFREGGGGIVKSFRNIILLCTL